MEVASVVGSTTAAATDAGFGVFWGSPASHDVVRAVTPGRTARSVTSARRLPPLPSQTASRSAASSAFTSRLHPPNAVDGRALPDRTPTSLLDVLHTLLANIRRDSCRFMADTFGTASRIPPRGGATSKCTSPPLDLHRHCYIPPPPGVEVEDREFFKQEKALAADRDAFFASTTLSRKRHCALDDLQLYHFDRSSSSKKKANRRSRSDRRPARGRELDVEMSQEAVVIERQRRKIEHLIHVLQTEIANETRRAIKLVEIQPPPRRPLSRQKQRVLVTVVKERCEAADRVMRILEEYKIVVGADAAKYLQETIAVGKAALA